MLLQNLSFILLILIGSNSACPKPKNDYIISLNSDNKNGEWTVQNANKSISTKAIVPGGIYSDLMKNGIIGDVFYKDNDVSTRWISKDSWTYTRKFTVSQKVLSKKTINIVLYGVDTIANISVNNKLIGITDNMFVKYAFDAKANLVDGENDLKIEFASPVLEAKKLSDEEMIPPACVPDEYNGECHVNQLRKMQASFSWDWGPGFPSVGIWKSVNLEAYNSALITDVTTNTIYNETDAMWYVPLKVYLDSSKSAENIEGHLVATLETDNNSSVSIYKFLNISSDRDNEVDMLFMISQSLVSRWWPNGYGEQRLYSLKVTFQSTQFLDEFVHKDLRIGFRTVELVQEPLSEDEDGLTFYFKINGHSIFMKGTNWIPLNVLPELGYDKKHVDYMLQSTKAIHSNMMRVWGGGVYESDYFYEKCDELGILIWQDLMYACNMYPVNDRFIRSVSQEIEHVVRRLQHHPSIAIWAGNNENEVALRGNWYGTGGNFEHYKQEYIKLYVDTIRPIVLQNDPSRSYLVSSPGNGIQSEKEGFIAMNPYDPHYGDTHYYNYLQDLWLMSTYPKTRFSSEYGFQGIPSIDTLKTATDVKEDLDISSEFMAHRQHLPNGYAILFSQLGRHFDLPPKNDSDYFSTLVYYSQIDQAMAMKMETEFYRQSRYDWMTMGALYWQLNDVWQAPSWSSIEFTGRWKMFHYFAMDFFSPILVSPRLQVTNDVSIFLINDNIEPVINAEMTIDTFKWSSLTPISTTSQQVNINGLSVEKLDSHIVVPHESSERAKIFYRFSLKDERIDKHLSPYNYVFPVHPKDIEGYKAPNIKIKVTEKLRTKHNDYNVLVTTDGIGLFIWLEIPYSIGWFSENGFVLTETNKTIIFHAFKDINVKQFTNMVKIITYKN